MSCNVIFYQGAETLLDGNDSTGLAFRHSWDTEQVLQRREPPLFTPNTRRVRSHFLCPCSSSVRRFFTYLPHGTLGRDGPAHQHIWGPFASILPSASLPSYTCELLIVPISSPKARKPSPTPITLPCRVSVVDDHELSV